MSKKEIKRVMIAAPSSGSGKTTLTCALLEVLKKRGLDPASFKCGPDYIDPLFHKKVLGIESRNLDTYFSGAQGVRDAVSGCSKKYAVIEGVMGLYDGIRTEGIEGSAYEIACEASSPVILVMDASKTGRTVISLVKGILIDDTEHMVKGIILNKISAAFYGKLKDVLEKELSGIRADVRLLGFFPKDKRIGIVSRHLGLTLPGEIENIREKLSVAAELLEENVDVDAVISIMDMALPTEQDSEKKIVTQKNEPDTNLTLAVADDEAFCFYYRENLEAFKERGVRICYFSPLKDEHLPEEADGLLLGGGYPEHHLEDLSKNTSMLESIRNALYAGLPSLAECGGFMYLHKTITDISGKEFKMAGVIDGNCFYTGKLVRFGYIKIQGVNEAFEKDGFFKSLAGMKGHEFHYYESTFNGNAYRAAKPFDEGVRECMTAGNNGIWGFPHFYYASKPEFVDCFVKRMKEVGFAKHE